MSKNKPKCEALVLNIDGDWIPCRMSAVSTVLIEWPVKHALHLCEAHAAEHG